MQTLQQPIEPLYTQGKAELFTIKSVQLGKWWPVILKFLCKVEDPDWTVEEVFEAIKETEAQVWGVVVDGQIIGIWITKVECNSKRKYGLVWIAAGEGLNLGLPLFTECEQWFKEMGCQYIEEWGRPGWQRVMKQYGYEAKQVVLRKYL